MYGQLHGSKCETHIVGLLPGPWCHGDIELIGMEQCWMHTENSLEALRNAVAQASMPCCFPSFFLLWINGYKASLCFGCPFPLYLYRSLLEITLSAVTRGYSPGFRVRLFGLIGPSPLILFSACAPAREQELLRHGKLLRSPLRKIPLRRRTQKHPLSQLRWREAI